MRHNKSFYKEGGRAGGREGGEGGRGRSVSLSKPKKRSACEDTGMRSSIFWGGEGGRGRGREGQVRPGGQGERSEGVCRGGRERKAL